MTNARDYKPDASGAVDQHAFETAIRENLSPEGVVMTIAYLRTATGERPKTDAGRLALQQVKWLADTLFEMVGTAEYNRLLEEIGL
jgi:hypothetical protein